MRQVVTTSYLYVTNLSYVVHGVGGVWGTLCVYIFRTDGLLLTGSKASLIGLGWNCVGLVTIIAWYD